MKKKLLIIYLTIVFAFEVVMVLGFRSILFEKFGNNSIVVGCLPNFLAVILISLIFNLIKLSNKDATPIKISLLGTITMTFYEFTQVFIEGRTFDYMDVFASILGGLCVYMLLLVTTHLSNKNSLSKTFS
jgi:hypothetical protein